MSRVVYNSEKRITQKFGNKAHRGCDIAHSNNEEYNKVYALTTGTVIKIVDGKNLNRGSTGNESYGNYIIIKHNNGLQSLYAHLLKNSIKVKVGSIVTKDTQIAIIGETGNAYGRHLHLEITLNNKLVDPLPYLTKDLEKTNIDVIYQAYDNTSKKWLSIITNYNTINYQGYAGYLGHSLGGIRVKLSNNEQIKYRVHIKNGSWLSWISKWDNTAYGYAGIKGKEIDGIQIKCNTQKISYRVHLKNKNWLSWIKKADDTAYGYAGLYNNTIDCLQIYVN